MVAAVTYLSNSGSQRITLEAQPVAGIYYLGQFFRHRAQHDFLFMLARKQASVPAASAETRTDIPSPTKTTSLNAPEPVANPTVPSTIDKASLSEDGESEGTSPSEDDESSGGAFNPVTGEINWDCPCLGGMAHGPCGPQFREAFSCFVFSEKEPKGIDCVEKFKGMQDCFREHPDIYGEGAPLCHALDGYVGMLIWCGIDRNHG